ncbi:BTAD domain-containing putative transcriptional regulator [Kitasatospora sp. NPDC057198]|uniref:BTAD domain-containing putative transcriptional regulator n=1 Tax=Kitasatospora sp. NPDC057198 TaxID=3346046 RepID=UPI00362A733A
MTEHEPAEPARPSNPSAPSAPSGFEPVGSDPTGFEPAGLEPAGFGALLRELRTRAGISQQTAAGRAGLSTRALRDLEHDRVRRPRERTVQRLVDALALTGPRADALRAAAARNDGPPGTGRGTTLLLLGPLLLRRGRDTVPIGSPTLRRLLGLLALTHPAAATRQEITDTLWPAGPPDSQQSLLHTHVSRLRRLLNPDDPDDPASGVVRTPTGYRLGLPRHRTDLGRFDDLMARTTCLWHAPDPEAAHQDLARALRHWRGPVLADADPALRRHPAAVAANERRVRAALLHADTALLLRRPDRAVPLLREVAHTEPLHEALHARLILTLAASGHQAAALDTYTRLRTRLDEELGVTPGPELHDAHLRVLRGLSDLSGLPGLPGLRVLPGLPGLPGPSASGPSTPAAPTAPPKPAQLPSSTGQFIGRHQQLRELDALLPTAPGDLTGRPRLVLVTGPPGIGKTALATHWAHRHRDRFPDGQLFADLRGHSTRPAPHPDDVLARFLRALGTPPDRLPADPDEAAALYRTLLADRRLLIVLDDARDAEQVRPLLPGAPGCAVLVTSRNRLTGLLAADGAHRLTLDALDPAEGALLLGTVLGPCRVTAEPAAAHRLVHACGGLPLALRIAAADLVSRGTALADYAPTATGHDDPNNPADPDGPTPGEALLVRLDLADDPRAGLRAAFDLSYRALPAPARRMFRLLGRAPAAGLGTEEAAARAATDRPEAAALLARLADAHLVREQPPGHYRLPGLLHPYAAALAAGRAVGAARAAAAAADINALCGVNQHPDSNQLIDVDHPVERRHAPHPDDVTVLGLICWKLGRLTESAEHFTRAARDLGGRTAPAPDTTAPTATAPTAPADREAVARTNLAVVQRALGLPGEAVRSIGGTLPVHRRHGNRFSEAVALTCLSAAHTDLGDHATGQLLAHTALTTARAVRSRALQANAQLALATAHLRARRPSEAAAAYREARRLAEAAGDRHPQAAALVGLAAALLDTDPRGALRTAEHALVLAREAGFRMFEGDALTVLARIRVRLGEPHTALALAVDALALHRTTGHRPGEARTLLVLALAADALGADADAVRHRREALHLGRAMGGTPLR